MTKDTLFKAIQISNEMSEAKTERDMILNVLNNGNMDEVRLRYKDNRKLIPIPEEDARKLLKDREIQLAKKIDSCKKEFENL